MTLCTTFSRSFGLTLLVPILLSLLLSLSSCTQSNNRPIPTPSDSEQDYIYHRIKYSGETVAVISAWYTKSAKNWPEIVDANPKMVPSKLRIGDLVRIPKRLVKRFSSLPADFVTSFKSGVNQDSSKGGTATPTGTAPSSELESGTKPDKGNTGNGNSGADQNKEIDPSAHSYEYNDSNSDAGTSTKSNDTDHGKKVVISPDTGTQMPDNDSNGSVVEPPPVKNPDFGAKAPESAPPANDENQKVRDQLMQELLQ